MKDLKFIHISKTSGTSIENIAKDFGINWGRFDEEYKKKSFGGEWWHKVINKSSSQDWFMVVRNPYDRIISEFHCNWRGSSSEIFTKEMFNVKVRYSINNWENKLRDSGHYIPQYLHLQTDILVHVLKFENIESEFNKLMNDYNLKLSLDRSDNVTIEKKFFIHDFDDETTKLINKIYDKDFELFKYSKMTHVYKSITLDKRQLCDFELITNGGFYPLDGFMNKKDYINCIKFMTIDAGFFPIPITLCITHKQKDSLSHEDTISIKDESGLTLGLMDISNENSIYISNLEIECLNVLGCYDNNHPYIQILNQYKNEGKIYNIGGKITHVQNIKHYDFPDIRLSPRETKDFFKVNKWENIIGFQTRNPMHRSHFELTKYALSQVKDAKLLIHPVVGITQECDIDYFTRVKCYKEIIKYYNTDTVKLSLLPLSMRMAGPREALLHALIRRNYGCTHFIVGRDHAGPSCKRTDGRTFYNPYDAQELLIKYADKIGIIPILSKEIVYTEPNIKNTQSSVTDISGNFYPIDTVDTSKMKIINISGTELRNMLNNNLEIPSWYSFPEVINELRSSRNTGICLYFIGLSGSGKSTMCNYILPKIRELTRKNVTILDGDMVRLNLSKELGFSKEDRSTNVRRIGYVASEIVKHNGIVLVANIAPFQEDRAFNRKIISQYGKYIEIFMDTHLDECEKRDIKGLYKLARNGIIKEFTGISSPFETPIDSEIIINGSEDLTHNINIIFDYIQSYLI